VRRSLPASRTVSTLVPFASPSSRSFRGRSSSPVTSDRELLPLLGFVRSSAPSSTYRLRVHSTEDESSDRSDGATRRILFRPRGFSPPRRLSPRSGCGLVASRYRPWGCLRFASRVPVRPSPRGRPGSGGRFDAPRMQRLTPFGGFPSPGSRAASLRPLPSCRYLLSGALRLGTRPFPDATFDAAPGGRPTSGPCSAGESVATARRFRREIARSSHGLRSPPRFRRPPLRAG
jgi:hypothetical protein